MASLCLPRRLLVTPAQPQISPFYVSLSLAFAGAVCTALAYLLISSILQYILYSLSDKDNDVPMGPSELRGIPVMVYRANPGMPMGGDTTCSVCLSDYDDGEELRVLPLCKHIFHRECVDRWLAVARSASSCPVCRSRIVEKPAGAPEAGCTHGKRMLTSFSLDMHRTGGGFF